MKEVACIEDLRRLHQKRVPKVFFDYADSGSYSEQTLRANSLDLQKIELRQRVLVDISNRDLSTTIVGEQYSLPLVLAPVGFTGMQWGDGEILACKAAQAAGVPYTLSTMSICSIEEVAADADKPFWFQLYVMRDRGFIKSLIERAVAAKCSALVLTVDLQIIGQRHADVRNGLTTPRGLLKASNLMDFARKPAWLLAMLNAKRRNFGNIASYIGSSDMSSITRWVASQFDLTLNWKDIEWIRSIWPGKLVLKGINDTEDAKIALGIGAEALIVSNHGGRQLDGAPSSISMLPKVADAVGSGIEVIFDGGIRSGQDIFRAIALGASSCMAGRSYVYGLGAGGQAGVAKAIDILRQELFVTMGLCGVSKITDINRQCLQHKSSDGQSWQN
jgi:L-lactate dehydrogenase (cytochrome)